MKQPFPQGDMSTGLSFPLDSDTGGQGIDIMGTCREKTCLLGFRSGPNQTGCKNTEDALRL